MSPKLMLQTTVIPSMGMIGPSYARSMSIKIPLANEQDNLFKITLKECYGGICPIRKYSMENCIFNIVSILITETPMVLNFTSFSLLNNLSF